MEKNKGKVIIFDFDDTLFETSRFKKEIAKIFAEFGIGRELFEKSYAESRGRKGYWQPIKQLAVLRKKLSVSAKKNILAALSLLFKRACDFLYPDTEPFLKKIKRIKNFKTAILSYGHPGIQSLKIKNCGIARFFDNITVAKGQDKLADLSGLLKKFNIIKNSQVFFIDDRAGIIDSAKMVYPPVIMAQIRRKGGCYEKEKSKLADFRIKNLRELGKLLKI